MKIPLQLCHCAVPHSPGFVLSGDEFLFLSFLSLQPLKACHRLFLKHFKRPANAIFMSLSSSKRKPVTPALCYAEHKARIPVNISLGVLLSCILYIIVSDYSKNSRCNEILLRSSQVLQDCPPPKCISSQALWLSIIQCKWINSLSLFFFSSRTLFNLGVDPGNRNYVQMTYLLHSSWWHPTALPCLCLRFVLSGLLSKLQLLLDWQPFV